MITLNAPFFQMIGLTQARTADALDDDHLLFRYPNIGRFTDDEIHAIAESHISRVDVHQADMLRVKDALFRLHANRREAAAVNARSAASAEMRPAHCSPCDVRS